MVSNLKLKKSDWQKIILGIRKKLNLSQTKLARKLCLSRQTISRFESKQRIPNHSYQKKILDLISNEDLDICELINEGTKYSKEYIKRQKNEKLDLKRSVELAELIGIILGDGEIIRDGTMRISFDPKKDKNFLNRRVIFLIKQLLNKKITYESNKRIAFGNIAFVRYLEQDCGLKPGSKFENNSQIPKWCFEKQEYISAVLRGLFDTDGYFGYYDFTTEIMYGRFSDKCTNLVQDIIKSLKILGLNSSVKHTKDGRFKIRICKRTDVLTFFEKIGTSNIKHIVRFLLWRFNRYEAKIELEGLANLILKTRSLYPNIEAIQLPFFWNLDNICFKSYVLEDLNEIEGAQIKNIYKWDIVSRDLIKYMGNNKLANIFNINNRSVRKWREGRRIPSDINASKLIKLLKEHNLTPSDYIMKNGKGNN